MITQRFFFVYHNAQHLLVARSLRRPDNETILLTNERLFPAGLDDTNLTKQTRGYEIFVIVAELPNRDRLVVLDWARARRDLNSKIIINAADYFADLARSSEKQKLLFATCLERMQAIPLLEEDPKVWMRPASSYELRTLLSER